MLNEKQFFCKTLNYKGHNMVHIINNKVPVTFFLYFPYLRCKCIVDFSIGLKKVSVKYEKMGLCLFIMHYILSSINEYLYDR